MPHDFLSAQPNTNTTKSKCVIARKERVAVNIANSPSPANPQKPVLIVCESAFPLCKAFIKLLYDR